MIEWTPEHRLVCVPKAASTTLAGWFGVPHRHVRAVELDGVLVATRRPSDEWTNSFARHVLRWAGESEWALEAALVLGDGSLALSAVVRGCWDLPRVRGYLPAPHAGGRCRITTPDAGWPSDTSRALTFFAPLIATDAATAYEAHYQWWCGDRIDVWIPWDEVRGLPLRLNRSAA